MSDWTGQTLAPGSGSWLVIGSETLRTPCPSLSPQFPSLASPPPSLHPSSGQVGTQQGMAPSGGAVAVFWGKGLPSS